LNIKEKFFIPITFLIPLPKPLPLEGGAYLIALLKITPFSLGRRGKGEEANR
jgi:hypothetical protein